MLLQTFISLILIKTSSFEIVLVYVGFTLNLCTFLAVAGVFACRIRYPDMPRPYKTWGYPIVPLTFLLIMGWNLIYLLIDRPLASTAGLAVMLLGLGFYFLSTKLRPTMENGKEII
jgi:APA family basic amino acid/polyamine antiporter